MGLLIFMKKGSFFLPVIMFAKNRGRDFRAPILTYTFLPIWEAVFKDLGKDGVAQCLAMCRQSGVQGLCILIWKSPSSEAVLLQETGTTVPKRPHRALNPKPLPHGPES